MRTAATFATEHGGKKVVLLHGPSVPIDEQKQEFKKLCAEPTHAKFERVELWESGSGIVRVLKLDPAKEEKKAKG